MVRESLSAGIIVSVEVLARLQHLGKVGGVFCHQSRPRSLLLRLTACLEHALCLRVDVARPRLVLRTQGARLLGLRHPWRTIVGCHQGCVLFAAFCCSFAGFCGPFLTAVYGAHRC